MKNVGVRLDLQRAAVGDVAPDVRQLLRVLAVEVRDAERSVL